MHSEKIMYIQSMIRATSTNFSDDDSKTLSKLSRIALTLNQTGPIAIASNLLDILNGHSFFKDIDRVCLVEIVGANNHLRTISSANSIHVTSNIMPLGYRCYVAPQGSLLHLKEGSLRTYSDAIDIIENYKNEGRPPQRSIRLIHEMGLRSGICISQQQNGKQLGFLLLNSRKKGFFKNLSAEQTVMLSLINMILKMVISEHKANTAPIFQTDLGAGAIFDAEQFKQDTEQRLEEHYKISSQINVTGDERFWLSHHEMVHVLSHLAWLENRQNGAEIFQADFERKEDIITATMPRTPKAPPWVHSELTAIKTSSTSFNFEIRENCYNLSFPYDPPHPDDAIQYSV